MRILPDRLVIESPGGVIGLSIHQLESSEHAQAAVNQRLYNIVRHLRTPDGAQVIEGEGGGIREVLELARAISFPSRNSSIRASNSRSLFSFLKHHSAV